MNKENIKIKKTWLFLSIEGHKKQRILNPKFKKFLWFLIFIISISLFLSLDFKVNKSGIEIFLKNLKKILSFTNFSKTDGVEKNLWSESFKLLFISIKTAITGTFLGFILSLISSFVTNSKFNNKYWSFINRILALFLRSIPEIFIITLFNESLNSQLAILMVYFWFTWLWLHKYFLEILQSVDTKYYYLSIKLGNSKFYAFFKEIWPRINNKFISLFLYSLESNIRWSALLSAMGLIGIGTLISEGKENANFLGIPLFILILFIILIEIFNILINKFLLKDISKKFNENHITRKKIFWITKKRKLFILFLFILIAIFSLYWIINTSSEIIQFDFYKNYIKSFFNPNFSILSFKSFSVEKNLILQILQTYLNAFIVFIILIAITIFLLYFLVDFNNSKYIRFLIKIFLILFRVTPVTIVYYVLSPLFMTSITPILIALGIHYSGSILKQLNETINKIEMSTLYNLKLNGWSKRKIYFNYLLPKIKIELIAILVVYFEICFRAIILYSFFSQHDFLLGGNMYRYLNFKTNSLSEAFAYMWIIIINILIINFIGWFITKKINRKMHI
ncbi:ABC transporter permease subunit [Mycoplasmopsis cricetuli]|uniref:ABC transporter permease subunit n=1 Tax=Mycoplasmopsis cricetuli TaxID=171283 RepID=UPI000471F856|nr:ABC transporter permease subunit [Mycoplasmopsis cricetuli]